MTDLNNDTCTEFTLLGDATVVRGVPRCRTCGERVNTSSIDRLTSLLDRWSWDEAALAALRSAREYRNHLALLFLDLNSFKKINDDAGHLTGDLVLRSVADVLRSCTRKQDILGRYGGHGGDEFLVLLPEVSESEAQGIAQRIRAGIESIVLSTATTAESEVIVSGLSASIGLAFYNGENTPNLGSLILEADVALRRAKRRHHGERSDTALAEVADERTRLPRIVDHGLFLRRLLDLHRLMDGDWVPEILLALSTGSRSYTDLLRTFQSRTAANGPAGRGQATRSRILIEALTRMEIDGLIVACKASDIWPTTVDYELTPFAIKLLGGLAAAAHSWSYQGGPLCERNSDFRTGQPR